MTRRRKTTQNGGEKTRNCEQKQTLLCFGIFMCERKWPRVQASEAKKVIKKYNFGWLDRTIRWRGKPENQFIKNAFYCKTAVGSTGRNSAEASGNFHSVYPPEDSLQDVSPKKCISLLGGSIFPNDSAGQGGDQKQISNSHFQLPCMPLYAWLEWLAAARMKLFCSSLIMTTSTLA